MIHIFGITVMWKEEFNSHMAYVDILQKTAQSNSDRVFQLKKEKETLKAERNRTVRELLDKINELKKKIDDK